MTSYPTPPASQTAPAQPARFVVRYGTTYCVICGLALPYCRGHAPDDPPASDGADSDLARRVREARARGGR